ncbi:hypothetical protein KQI82_03280 [Oscillibacter sp. MSJ-2]|uniref:DUF6199 domain-containing protein n=1 Tax=Dysosmobacter acutus TaxID=2841504 RepID=A0ABS6F8J7_9FIRM|nr:DUF6199 family natural product biosynthesis protein [Dysosmobacter acutus]MBU5625961.1 hypothetical protein [Dysosmobacter acutus]
MRIRLFPLLALLLALLCACGSLTPSTTYEVSRDGWDFVVDTEQQTITCGGDVFQYTADGRSVEITYPDGSTYFRTYDNMGWHGGWSDGYSEDRYIPGDTLVELISGGAEQPEKSSGNSPFIGLLLLAIGGFNAISPQTSWYLSYGWRFKDAEPSDAALVLGRCGGVLAAVIGFFLLFF